MAVLPSPYSLCLLVAIVQLNSLIICCTPVSASSHFVYPPLPAVQQEDETKSDTPLYVGLVESYDASLPDEQLGAVGTVVGAEIALDHINAAPDMLPGYSLHFNFVNSQVGLVIDCDLGG